MYRTRSVVGNGYRADEEVSGDVVAAPSTFHPPDAEGVAEAFVS